MESRRTSGATDSPWMTTPPKKKKSNKLKRIKYNRMKQEPAPEMRKQYYRSLKKCTTVIRRINNNNEKRTASKLKTN